MLLTPELLDEINPIVVRAGHVRVKKKENEALRGRCDSFVVETNVHYPTDINLRYDAMRKVITLTAPWCDTHGLSDWRQSAYHLRRLKRLMRTAQNKERSKAKSAEQVTKNEALIIKAHREYLTAAQTCLTKADQTFTLIEKQGGADALDAAKKLEIEGFIPHAERQIDHIRRRVIRIENRGMNFFKLGVFGQALFSKFAGWGERVANPNTHVPNTRGAPCATTASEELKRRCVAQHEIGWRLGAACWGSLSAHHQLRWAEQTPRPG